MIGSFSIAYFETTDKQPPLIDGKVVDVAMLLTGMLIALATIWLQWFHFKKAYPPTHAKNENPSNYLRWRSLYWREVRATFGFAFISLCLVGFTVFFYKKITMVSLVSVIFWLGMFFYNLWLAQWYAWRISTKRRR
ncbi:MAG: hypothetical protein LBV12_06840 [Puniceicoccales bacterium]|jgi:hypothetical protein|nr:hypothetical protein [Puniceicoccales bacterium]